MAELYLQQGFRDEALQVYRQLAELNPRHFRVDRFELATNFIRSVGLQIDCVLMRNSSGQIDHDHGLVR